MLTRIAVASLPLLAATACSADSGDDELGARVHAVLAADPGPVVARLAELGVDVGAGALEDAEIGCPKVDEPEPGDTATCVTELADREVSVDVEFTDDGGVRIVCVEVVE
jgi:hypothetical protein